MPLTPQDSAFLKAIFQNLQERPLFDTDADPRYVPLYETMDDGDPVERLYKGIFYSDSQSRQFFSGFRGSGKSTQLFRLKKRLEEGGYRVFYADAHDYFNLALPIDITDVLVRIAGAFSDVVRNEEGVDLTGESYWDRFWHYLNTTQVKLEGIDLGLFKDSLKLKSALKDSPTFRQRLQEAMSLRLSELEAQVKRFFEDYVKKLRERHPADAGVVFLFDNLEQMRGSASTEREVIASALNLFSNHIERLTIPYLHVVYTVPPWLKFLMNAVNVEILPSIAQWNNDDARTEKPRGNDCLREVLRARVGSEEFLRFFRTETDADELVKVCGGNLRDLIRLLRQTILRASSLPLEEKELKASIRAVREDFLPIPLSDAIWLAKVSKIRDTALPDSLEGTIARFSLFLDSHYVLLLRNGDEWYDIHPLIREYAEQIASRETETTAAIAGNGSEASKH